MQMSMRLHLSHNRNSWQQLSNTKLTHACQQANLGWDCANQGIAWQSQIICRMEMQMVRDEDLFQGSHFKRDSAELTKRIREQCNFIGDCSN